MFCVNCGEKATAKMLCDKCFNERNELFTIKDFRMDTCSLCGSFYDREWQTPQPLDEIIADQIRSHIKTKGRISSTSVSEKRAGTVVMATVTCTGRVPPAKMPKTETKKVEIRIRAIKCENCVKLLGGYHNAVIQIRGIHAEEILARIRGGRVEKVKEGYNIKFTEKGAAARIAKSLESDFSVIRSFKLAGEKKGDKLYRNYYAIR